MSRISSGASDEQGGLDLEALRRRRWLSEYERCRLGVKTAPGERDLSPAEADAEHLSFLRDLLAPDALDRLTDRARRPFHPSRYRNLADRGLDPQLSRGERQEAAWSALARAWERIGARRSPKPWWNALNEEATDLIEDDAPALDPGTEDEFRVERQVWGRPAAPDQWFVRDQNERIRERAAADHDLSAKKEKAYRLRYGRGWQVKEIAEEFGRAPCTISNWISDAQDALNTAAEALRRDAV